MTSMGGFLTRRQRRGEALAFSLYRPDTGEEGIFLDFSSGRPLLFPEVFETLGASALKGEVLVLDEIGGVELLCPGFRRALEETLDWDVPILGVLKGPAAADALAQTLGLRGEYRRQAAWLRDRICRDRGTDLYSCGQYDEKALALARQWVREYGL